MGQVQTSGSPRVRASQHIEESLQRQILSGVLEPGAKLPSEQALCRQYQASRTAVREAIGQLKGCGLVETVNGSGSFVSRGRLENVFSALNAYSVLVTDGDAFADLLDLRMAIEGESAARVAEAGAAGEQRAALEKKLLAMRRVRLIEEFALLDIDFHMELLRASGNRLFAMLGDALRDRYARYVIDSYRELEVDREDTLEEHQQIMDAIGEGNGLAARESARRHIAQSRVRWEKLQRGKKHEE